MKKRIFILLSCLCWGAVASWAIPQSITYQGTLKQKGIPVTGQVNMQFAFVNADGTAIPGALPISTGVVVTNGLFAVQLSLPANIDWAKLTPAIQVFVGSQQLSPAQIINSNLYSIVSQTVVDGAITLQKLDVNIQDQLIPTGMIAMFTNTCPKGWIEFTNLQGRFPVGQDPNNSSLFAIGHSGGSLTHDHTISMDGSHSHRLSDGPFPIFGQAVQSPGVAVLGGPGADGQLLAATGGNQTAQTKLSTTDASGAHNHGGLTGNASSLPPYVSMIFCQKQ